MIRVFLFLFLAVTFARGAANDGGYQRNSWSTNMFAHFKYATGYVATTNLLRGSTNGDVIWVRTERPDRKMLLPTNTFGLLRNGVEIFFDNVELHAGHLADGASPDNRRLFSEFDDSPSTNYVWGRWTLTTSNQNSSLIYLRNSGSKLYFQNHGMTREYTSSGGVCARQEDGTSLVLDVQGDVLNKGYDGIWISGTGAGVRTYVNIAGRLAAEDTAIEFNGGYDEGYPGVFNVGSIARINTTGNPGGLISFGLNMVVNVASKIGGTGGGTNWYIGVDSSTAPAGVTTASILNCPSIQNDATHEQNPYLIQAWDLGSGIGRLRVIGAKIDGPTNSAAALVSLYNSQVSFEFCKLNARRTDTTNSIEMYEAPVGTETLDVPGTTWNAPIESSLLPSSYIKAQFATNVNANVSLVEGVTAVFVRTLASSGDKDIILTNANRYVRGDSVLIKDAAGTSSNGSSNVVVKSASGNIDGVLGSTGKTITTDYGAFVFWTDGTNWWSR